MKVPGVPHRLLSVGTAGIILLAPSHARLGSGQPGPAAAIAAVLQQAVDRGDIPGVVAMATSRERLIYSGAFGWADGAARRPMTLDAIFRIASMTKPVTSVALMQLVEQQKVGLDDPVERYLKAFARPSVLTSFDSTTGEYTVRPASRPVTVRHLLTHTSGLGYGFTSATVRDFKPRGGESFGIGPLLFEPGEQWLYGTSTDWVGRLVEALSGEDLETYFRSHITGPLAMTDTAFNVAPAAQPRLVTSWRRDASGALAEQPRQSTTTVTQFNGGGGLSATAEDYLKFMRMILNDGRAPGGDSGDVRILSAASVAAMSRNQMGAVRARALRTALPPQSADFSFINDGRDAWGLGFLISTAPRRGLRSAGSLSWGGINNTYFWIDRTKGIAGVIMMQFLPFADPKALAVAEAFERAVYDSR